ncbi:MAG: nucleotidyl transferase AbiEii/AbiGii toxin family protein [Microgenomates group bacterium]
MLTNKIPRHTQDVLAAIGDTLPPGSYLAGGTALALHLDHRKSFDLDFYSPQKFESEIQLERIVEVITDFKLISTSWQTLIGSTQETEISLFFYKYPLIGELSQHEGTKIASIADIACMKLEAVGGRGLKRDFFDLYTICQLADWNLQKVIDLNRKKYGRDESDIPHILKSLVYFDDAENLPERAEIVEADWKKIKSYFVQETKGLISTLL